jgi:hypothetical protein
MAGASFFCTAFWRNGSKEINEARNRGKNGTHNTRNFQVRGSSPEVIVVTYNGKRIENKSACKKSYRESNEHGMQRVSFDTGFASHDRRFSG